MALKNHLSIAPYEKQTEEHAVLERIAESIRIAAYTVGVADTLDPRGGLEMLADVTRDGSEQIAASLTAIATALEHVADAIRETRK